MYKKYTFVIFWPDITCLSFLISFLDFVLSTVELELEEKDTFWDVAKKYQKTLTSNIQSIIFNFSVKKFFRKIIQKNGSVNVISMFYLFKNISCLMLRRILKFLFKFSSFYVFLQLLNLYTFFFYTI